MRWPLVEARPVRATERRIVVGPPPPRAAATLDCVEEHEDGGDTVGSTDGRAHDAMLEALPIGPPVVRAGRPTAQVTAHCIRVDVEAIARCIPRHLQGLHLGQRHIGKGSQTSGSVGTSSFRMLQPIELRWRLTTSSSKDWGASAGAAFARRAAHSALEKNPGTVKMKGRSCTSRSRGW
eukprot:CAMPEP_0181176082 /NCGR_PEP_ID=MMETSP1096-20121128/4433_1 /TAXON_ID=156174 ORGANISM="Chrysochromulina ericina, Strain CCMP281" /NCGR_SAMPLE_ID=MMETSP1096 /ASSEMBLY_ACC=CAM_ASM_000453 /LENGTH=178 /DNA_ID=CAMNT_0023264133 /DNA_START=501 /DNA_END=1035 /DNA_ORIENTATION=+